jgi:predicted RNase H-like nuclease
VNREVTGRGLSIQAWQLASRIREVEACLRVTPRRMHVVVEAHPELAFHLLAGRSGRERRPLAPKRSAEGRRQRRDVLECILPSAPALLDAVAIPRREASPDDWVDALVLACVLYRDGGAITLLPDPPERDETGLPMAIAVPVSPAGGVEAGNL